MLKYSKERPRLGNTQNSLRREESALITTEKKLLQGNRLHTEILKTKAIILAGTTDRDLVLWIPCPGTIPSAYQ